MSIPAAGAFCLLVLAAPDCYRIAGVQHGPENPGPA
jgi:hypothetical protein